MEDLVVKMSMGGKCDTTGPKVVGRPFFQIGVPFFCPFVGEISAHDTIESTIEFSLRENCEKQKPDLAGPKGGGGGYGRNGRKIVNGKKM